MATVTRAPTSDEAVSGTWNGSAGTRYAVVDDYPDTTPTDTLLHGTTTAGNLTFGFSAFSIPAGATNISVQVMYYDQKTASQACTSAGRLKVGGTYYNATTHNPAQSYTQRTDDWTTNPKTSAAWTVAQVNGTDGTNPLQAFGFFSNDANPSINYSSVQIQVTYTPAYKLTADAGTFTESGVAATLLRSRLITGDKGTFTESGVAATLLKTDLLTAAVGGFTVSGQDAVLSKGFKLSADFGKFFLPERNLRQYSEEFDNAYWTKTNSSITANSTAAPDGTLTADVLIENSAASVGHQITRNFTFVAGKTYTHSCYFKLYPGTTTRYVRLQLGSATAFGTDVYININLATGTISATSGSPSATSITNIGNGWYRASITKQYTGAGITVAPGITLTNTSGGSVYTGDGTSGVYVWGVQFEEGALTDYDPVGASSATTTDLRKTRINVASAGSFSVAGSANILRSKLLTSAAGAYVLDGKDANFIYVPGASGYTLTSSTGGFTLGLNSASLLATHLLGATAGSYSLIGKDASTLRSRLLVGAPGALSASFSVAELIWSNQIRIISDGQVVRMGAIGSRTELPWWEGDYQTFDPRYVLRDILGRTYNV